MNINKLKKIKERKTKRWNIEKITNRINDHMNIQDDIEKLDKFETPVISKEVDFYLLKIGFQYERNNGRNALVGIKDMRHISISKVNSNLLSIDIHKFIKQENGKLSEFKAHEYIEK
ncbi:hypothetical protein [Clostridioides difficile]|uniref:hypothetical protein n=1 Tax=Clostridioides difficile TaxID=1496 RepID=UPI001B8B6882|nr:hypothetical protein [Clostridioides difficile]MBS1296836.1 hypothetical protein [Clostridioides difficile]HDG7527530.1 hypothetical protein [Clostridioides difficile]